MIHTWLTKSKVLALVAAAGLAWYIARELESYSSNQPLTR